VARSARTSRSQTEPEQDQATRSTKCRVGANGAGTPLLGGSTLAAVAKTARRSTWSSRLSCCNYLSYPLIGESRPIALKILCQGTLGQIEGMILIVRAREHQPTDELGRGNEQNYQGEIVDLVEFDLPTVGTS
jgi:hypothetical protein